MPDTAPESTPEPAPKRRPWWRRWLRRLTLATCALAVALVGLYLSRAHTLNPLALRALRWAAPRFSDFEVEASALTGDWFSGLGLEELVVVNVAPHGVLRRLEGDRVEFSFHLLDLVRDGLAGLEAVDLGQVRVEVDLGAPPAPETVSAGDAPAPEFPSWLPLVQLERLDLDLRLPDGTRVRVDEASLTSHRSAEGPAYELRLPHAAVEGSVPFATSATLRVACRGATVIIDEVTLQETPLAGFLELDLDALPHVGWRADISALDGRATSVGRLAGDEVVTNLTLEHLRLSHVKDLFEAPWAATLTGEIDLDFDLTGDLADPDLTVLHVELAGRALAFEGRRVETLTASGEVIDGVAHIAQLEAHAGNDHVTVRDLDVPFGDGPDLLLENLAGALSLEVTDLAPWLHGDAPPAQELPPHRIHLDATVAGGRASFTGGQVAVADGILAVRAGTLRFPGADDPGALELDLTADFADLAPVGALLASEGWAGAVVGEVKLAGPLDALVGKATLRGDDVVVAGFALGTVEVDAHTDGAHLVVDAARATTDDLTFSLAGGYVFASEALDASTLSLEVTRPHRFADLLAPGGRLKVDLSARGRWDTPSGGLSVTGHDLVAAGVPIADLRVEGVMTEGWLNVSQLTCGTPYCALTAAFEVRLPLGDAPITAHLRTLGLDADGHTLALVEPAPIDLGETVTVGPMHFTGTAGELTLELTLVDEDLHAVATATDLDLTPFVRELLPAEIPAVQLDLDGAYAAGRLELARLVARVEEATLLDVEASLPLDPLGEILFAPGEVRVKGHVALPPGQTLTFEDGAALYGQVFGEVDLSGTWRALAGTVTLDAQDVGVTPEGRAQPFLAGAAAAHLALTLHPERVSLSTFELTLPERVTLGARGNLAAGVDVEALARGDWSTLEAAEVEFDGDLGFLDLAWIAKLDDSLRRIAGHTSGAIRVRGTLGDPDLGGELSLSEGHIKVVGAPELEALHATVVLDGNVVTVRDTGWEMGAAPVTLAGTIDFTDGRPTLDLTIAGEGALLSRSASQRIRGDLDVSVRGPLEQLEIGGEVGLRHSKLMQNINFLAALQRGGSVQSRRRGLALPSLKDGPLATARFDLALKTYEPMRLISNVMRGNLRVDLVIGGTGEVLVPSGRVFLDDLRARLPGGTVVFPLGLITFEEGNPYDPRLEINGEAYLAGYDVTLNVSGNLSDPAINASSTPGLPGDELMLLILTGQVPSAGTGGEAAARSLGMYVAKDLFAKWMGGTWLDNDRDSFWSRLEITSGRNVSKAGVVTLEVTYRWRDADLDAQSGVYLVAERDVYEDYNMGVRFVLRRR